MRASVELDEDTAKAVEALRRERGIGISEAVNELIRRGLLPRGPVPKFRQRTKALGLRLDVSKVPEALDILEAASDTDSCGER